MPIITCRVIASLLMLVTQALAAGQNPLEVVIESHDAQRFAAMFQEHDGTLTAAQIEDEYLSQAGEGLALMRATRFKTAEVLAEAVTRSPALYRDTIERCLPVAQSIQPDLRALYLALARLIILQGKDMDLQNIHYEAIAILVLAVSAIMLIQWNRRRASI